MKILVVGSGGREHAIVRKLLESVHAPEVHAAPGNPGIARIVPCHAVGVDQIDAMVSLAQEQAFDWVFVGPEIPLALGLVDRLQEVSIPALGPTQAAARLESSKVFSKELMLRHGIPTAAFLTFTELDPLLAHLSECPVPVVVKASGLAAGKGAVVCMTREEAIAAARQMLGDDKIFGEAGDEVVVEEFMQGEELSVFALCDGSRYILLPSAQDHKRLRDGDQGPNTGGMGAYSPAPIATPAVLAAVCQNIVEPTLKAMEVEGCPYHGILYVGVMLTKAGPKVVEFNCRLGDPETQCVLPILEADLVDLCQAALARRLGDVHVTAPRRWSSIVVLAAEGYPGTVRKGRVVAGLDQAEALENVHVLHAGTTVDDQERVVTSGGRVLGVVGTGETLAQAVENTYRGVDSISFEGMQFRKDIAARGLAALISRGTP
ncbi:MAG: phosphoribosylamine--glycine ligase [Fibrobacteres bacterium]|nr:phosphoribosylamine--glycine ligase [Fibrobacterota bacterium]